MWTGRNSIVNIGTGCSVPICKSRIIVDRCKKNRSKLCNSEKNVCRNTVATFHGQEKAFQGSDFFTYIFYFKDIWSTLTDRWEHKRQFTLPKLDQKKNEKTKLMQNDLCMSFPWSPMYELSFHNADYTSKGHAYNFMKCKK